MKGREYEKDFFVLVPVESIKQGYGSLKTALTGDAGPVLISRMVCHGTDAGHAHPFLWQS